MEKSNFKKERKIVCISIKKEGGKKSSVFLFFYYYIQPHLHGKRRRRRRRRKQIGRKFRVPSTFLIRMRICHEDRSLLLPTPYARLLPETGTRIRKVDFINVFRAQTESWPDALPMRLNSVYLT
uniref:Uncharacterized protein n=1 Tax=Cacopsylla melanoneura TaxID=428564 RepID=A0A8D9BEZ7_9HEMI